MLFGIVLIAKGCLLLVSVHQCSSESFNCSYFDKPGVQRKDLIFPETSVPGDENSYYCHGFKLPTDATYHIIGLKPRITNKDMVHDIIVYGCDDKSEESFRGYQELKKCFAGLDHCRTPIGACSSELEGQCFAEDFGLAMGQTGYKYVVVQIHWHNRRGLLNQRDSSGMILYYTSQLRNNTGQVLRIGQRYINLPKGRRDVKLEGTCTGSCTELIASKETRIASAFIRMNKFGTSGGIDLWSGNSIKMRLLDDQRYNLNQPQLISFKKPVSFEGGEEIKITCRYNTESQIGPVHYGEGDDREMCAGFITIYPATPNMTICSQWKDLTMCSLNSALSYPDCDQKTFFRLLPLIDENCNQSCDGLCAVILRGFTHTGCYKHTLAEFIDEFYVNTNNRMKNYLFPLIKTCLPKVSSAGRIVPLSFSVGLALLQALFHSTDKAA